MHAVKKVMGFVALLVLLIGGRIAQAQSLTADPPGPVPAGTVVTFKAVTPSPQLPITLKVIGGTALDPNPASGTSVTMRVTATTPGIQPLIGQLYGPTGSLLETLTVYVYKASITPNPINLASGSTDGIAMATVIPASFFTIDTDNQDISVTPTTPTSDIQALTFSAGTGPITGNVRIKISGAVIASSVVNVVSVGDIKVTGNVTQAIAGQTVSFTATPNPSTASFPAGQPVWTIISGSDLVANPAPGSGTDYSITIKSGITSDSSVVVKAACGPGDTGVTKTIQVKKADVSVSFDKSSLNKEVGGSDIVIATIYPESEAGRVTFDIDDPTVATVKDETGSGPRRSLSINALKVGTCILFAKVDGARTSSQVNISVTAASVLTLSRLFPAAPPIVNGFETCKQGTKCTYKGSITSTNFDVTVTLIVKDPNQAIIVNQVANKFNEQSFNANLLGTYTIEASSPGLLTQKLSIVSANTTAGSPPHIKGGGEAIGLQSGGTKQGKAIYVAPNQSIKLVAKDIEDFDIKWDGTQTTDTFKATDAFSWSSGNVGIFDRQNGDTVTWQAPNLFSSATIALKVRDDGAVANDCVKDPNAPFDLGSITIYPFTLTGISLDKTGAQVWKSGVTLTGTAVYQPSTVPPPTFTYQLFNFSTQKQVGADANDLSSHTFQIPESGEYYISVRLAEGTPINSSRVKFQFASLSPGKLSFDFNPGVNQDTIFKEGQISHDILNQIVEHSVLAFTISNNLAHFAEIFEKHLEHAISFSGKFLTAAEVAILLLEIHEANEELEHLHTELALIELLSEQLRDVLEHLTLVDRVPQDPKKITVHAAPGKAWSITVENKFRTNDPNFVKNKLVTITPSSGTAPATGEFDVTVSPTGNLGTATLTLTDGKGETATATVQVDGLSQEDGDKLVDTYVATLNAIAEGGAKQNMENLKAIIAKALLGLLAVMGLMLLLCLFFELPPIEVTIFVKAALAAIALATLATEAVKALIKVINKAPKATYDKLKGKFPKEVK